MRSQKLPPKKKPQASKPPPRRRIRTGALLSVNGTQCRCKEVTKHGYAMAPVDDPRNSFLLTCEELDLIMVGQHSFRF